VRFSTHLMARIKAAWLGAATAWAHSAPASSHEHDLSEVLEHSADCVVQTNTAGGIIYLNPAARRALSLASNAPISGLRFTRFAEASTRRQIADVVAPALEARGVWVGEITFRLGLRRRVPFSLMALAHRDAHGRTVRYSAVMRDIATDMHARQQIQRQNNVLSAISEAMPATVVIVDSQGRYRFVNSAFERYVGLTSEQILGRTAIEVLGHDEVRRRKPYMQKAMAGEAVDFTLDYPSAQGTTYLALNCIPLKLDGVLDGFVGISQDITHQRKEQDRLAHLAERDSLTGLLNRAGLEQRVEHKLWSGDGLQLALLYIDLDHFKPVNDQHGHQAGDRLLQMFARRMSEAVRSSDFVARIGGDEFVILLTGVSDLSTAEIVADKVLEAASLPFEIDGQAMCVSASIGVALVAQADAGIHDLLSRADNMLYRAKAAGRGCKFSQPVELAQPAVEAALLI
jgi:diguanylate cyclase (GGDEF)-like protein/PAS domain S-box-containing protein